MYSNNTFMQFSSLNVQEMDIAHGISWGKGNVSDSPYVLPPKVSGHVQEFSAKHFLDISWSITRQEMQFFSSVCVCPDIMFVMQVTELGCKVPVIQCVCLVVNTTSTLGYIIYVGELPPVMTTWFFKFLTPHLQMVYCKIAWTAVEYCVGQLCSV